MCGENSVEAVVTSKSKTSVGAVGSKTGVKLAFVIMPDGSIGTSHGQIRTAHKILPTRHFVNMNIRPDGSVDYEKGTPSWFNAKLQASAEKQAKALLKAVTAYKLTLVNADAAEAKAVAYATQRAHDAKLVKRSAAFAKLTKLGARPV